MELAAIGLEGGGGGEGVFVHMNTPFCGGEGGAGGDGCGGEGCGGEGGGGEGGGGGGGAMSGGTVARRTGRHCGG